MPEALPARKPQTAASRLIVLILGMAIVLSALAFGAVHSWSLAFFLTGAAVIVLLWTMDAWQSRELKLSRHVLQWPVLGLFLFGLVQLLPLGANHTAALPVEAARSLSFDPYSTRFALIQIGPLFIYFAAALVFINSPQRLRLVVRTITVFGATLAVLGLMQFFTSPRTIFWFRNVSQQAVPFGPFINSHHFAGYMALALAVPLGLLFSGAVKSEWRLLYMFSVAVMAIALIVTGSRAGMLSFVCEVSLLVVLAGVGLRRSAEGTAEQPESGGSSSRARAIAVRAAVSFALVVAIFMSVTFFGGEESLNRLLNTAHSNDPTTGRTHFWAGAIEMIRHHPLAGVGLGAFGVAYTRYNSGPGIFRLEQAHNDYLQILSDGGIIGGLLALFFIIMLFRIAVGQAAAARDKYRRGVALGALAGCFAALVHSLFDFTLHTTSNALLFLVLAALATLGKQVEESSSKSPGRRRASVQ